VRCVRLSAKLHSDQITEVKFEGTWAPSQCGSTELRQKWETWPEKPLLRKDRCV